MSQPTVIAAALSAVDPRCDVLVLLLGDQPGVTPATVDALLAALRDAGIADEVRAFPAGLATGVFWVGLGAFASVSDGLAEERHQPATGP